jgi:hypothetical protein
MKLKEDVAVLNRMVFLITRALERNGINIET